MRFLIINSRYFLSAGPEKYMFGLKDLLEKKGHVVIPFSVKNSKNRKTKYSKYFIEPIGGEDKVYFEEYSLTPSTIRQGLGRMFYSRHVKEKLKALIRDTKPDIAYILHHYNKLSPSIIDACKEEGVPVIMRLSDHFLVCPEGHLLRHGTPCELCIEKSLWQCVFHRCVKRRLLPSIIKAAATKYHRKSRIYHRVDRIVCPSTFTISKVDHLFGEGKIYNLPTFIIPDEKPNKRLGKYALFTGRVEEEKGLIYALKALKGTPYKLRIAGSSHSGHARHLKRFTKESKMDNVEFLDYVEPEKLRKLYRNARFILFPTVCYENMPNTVLEAMLFSRPTLTSDIGSMPELIQDNHNGLLFRPKDADDLRNKLKLLFEDDDLCRRLGANAYKDVLEKYSPEKHYQRLMDVIKTVFTKETPDSTELVG